MRLDKLKIHGHQLDVWPSKLTGTFCLTTCSIRWSTRSTAYTITGCDAVTPCRVVGISWAICTRATISILTITTCGHFCKQSKTHPFFKLSWVVHCSLEELLPSRHGPVFHQPQSQITIDSPDFSLRRSQNCLRGLHSTKQQNWKRWDHMQILMIWLAI